VTKRRRVAHVSGGRLHANPIPEAVRIDNIVYSSAISGVDPKTMKAPDDLEEQVRLCFAHMKELLESVDASLDDIVKLEVSMTDSSPEKRAVLNKYWLATFPNEEDRPARHTSQGPLSNNYLIQFEFVAVV
jgi:enamine deaminase RidA (YjgF/YER057c/UK114 family)